MSECSVGGKDANPYLTCVACCRAAVETSRSAEHCVLTVYRFTACCLNKVHALLSITLGLAAGII